MNPSTPTANRKLLHTRQITCKGYVREDGLWDVEGYLADVRSVDCLSKRREILVRAGDTLHGMRLRITLDDGMRIVDAHAVTEASPHGECRSISAAYAALKGLIIGPGFLSAVRERFRGIRGCTHLTELIGPVATTAIQTVISAREQRAGLESASGTDADAATKALVDSCHAWRRGGEAFFAHVPSAVMAEKSAASERIAVAEQAQAAVSLTLHE